MAIKISAEERQLVKNKILATGEVNKIVNHWRLASQKKNFHR